MTNKVVWTDKRLSLLRQSSHGKVIYKSPSKLLRELQALPGLPIFFNQLKRRVNQKGLRFNRPGKRRKNRKR